ncbi:MAG: TolC family protein, partial [Bacteroidota bacterium]
MRYLYLIGLLLGTYALSAQSVLPLDAAIQTALANNHQIQIKRMNARTQALRVDPALVGKKLVGNLNASYEIGWSSAEIETLPLGPGENEPLELDGISNDIIVAPEVSYVLLDGKAGNYRLEQLGTLSRLAELELRQTIEQTIAEVSTTYFQLAELQTQLDLSRQRIALTQDRLQRAQQDASYGTSSSLQELQIKVDLQTDSAALRDLTLAYENAQRQFNRLVGQATDDRFQVDTEVTSRATLSLTDLEQKLLARNAILKLSQEGVRLAELDVRLSEAAFRP